MASMNFPDTPAVDELYTAPNGVQYQYDGSVWNVVAAAAGVPGPAGPQGPAGPAGAGLKYVGRVPTTADLAGVIGITAVGEFWIVNETGEGWQCVENSSVPEGKSFSDLGRLVGEDGKDGTDGLGFRYIGRVNTYADLPAIIDRATVGEVYIANDTGVGYQCIALSSEPSGKTWYDLGRLVGEDGVDGKDGVDGTAGYSARYAGRIETYTELEALMPNARPGQFYITNDRGEGYYALESSNTPGTVSAWEFMGRLIGADGVEGPAGPTGPQGPAGMGINLKGHVATVADLPATATQGDTYIVDADGNAYSWSDADNTYLNIGKIVGPQGEQGIQGPQGIQGETGPQGPAGVDGAVGPAGADGVAGADGKDGAVGPQGPAGADGAVGPKGDTGDQGIQGIQGEAGPQGLPGADGPAGADGAEGPAGPQGDQGPAGVGITLKGRVATEADLPTGAAQGDTYVVDETGNAWSWTDSTSSYTDLGKVVGPQGPVGATGPQGVKGDTGPAGPTGPQGPKGDQGMMGYDGQKGATGATGPAGPAGPTAVSKDAGNTAVLGSDNLLFVPAGTGGGGAYLPLAGGAMTGTIASSSATPISFINTYSLFSANGGVSFRFGATDLMAFSSSSVIAYKPLITPATGPGVQFGSGGAYMSKTGTGAGVYAGGALKWTFDTASHTSMVPIVLPADPQQPSHAATKQYVDSAVAGAGGSGATIVSVADGATEPAASGYPEGALLVRYTP